VIGPHFRPLGGFHASTPTKLSRRIFLGAGFAAPVVLLYDARARTPTPPANNELRFVKDAEGVSVIAPAPVTPKDPSDMSSNPVWRLHGLSFGRETTFLLRTLTAGRKKGYELEVANVGFGTKKGRKHWFVFLLEKDGWKVRMRTNSWSANGGEITAPEVALSKLAVPPGDPKKQSCNPASLWFQFVCSAAEISDGLARACEGHVRAVGAVRLELDSDGVWRILPAGSGRLVIAPYGFVLAELALAWCETVSETAKACATALTNNLFALGALNGQGDTDSTEPVFCASGTIKRGNLRVRCQGDSSFAATLEHIESKEDTSTMSYVFVRQDWRNSARGASEIRGSWQVSTKVGRMDTLSAVRVSGATLRARSNQNAPAMALIEFSGMASPDHELTTRIGRIKATDWGNKDSSSPDSTQRIQINAQYADISGPTSAPASATSVRIPLLLLLTEFALEGAELGQLSFQSTSLVGMWERAPRDPLPADQSYLWLGTLPSPGGKPMARLDLSRARLEASRSRDLLRVSFLFSDLYLEVRPRSLKIVPASSTCRVLKREAPTSHTLLKAEPELIDARPTLVVEFPPQHIFEETLFKPAGADLPEVEIPPKQITFQVTLEELGALSGYYFDHDPQVFSTVPAKLALRLAVIPDADYRKVIRRKYADIKKALENGSNYQPFTTFSTEFEKAFNAAGFDADIADQAVYIGPYEMHADVSALARTTMRELQKKRNEDLFQETLNTAADLALRLNDPKATAEESQTLRGRLVQSVRKFLRERFGSSSEAVGPELALQREEAISAVLPDYLFFRDFYRQEMTERLMLQPEHQLKPTNATPQEIEYFSVNNREWLGVGAAFKDELAKRHKELVKVYLQKLDGGDLVLAFVRARLANPSRLAFRLNCQPDESFDFSLEELTDWSRHELAVTPRARAISVFDESGRPLPDASSSSNGKDSETRGAAEDIAMLGLLGIHSGRFVTAQERLSDVEASLRKPPGPLETAIEIPARLILSPSQRALWKTPFVPAKSSRSDSSRRKNGRRPARSVEGPVLLWGADLVTDNPQPAVRAVHSPDLRPGFVRRGLERAATEWANTRKKDGGPPFRTVALCAPPRGPRAPWTIGIEEGDPSSSSLKDVIAALGGNPETVASKQEDEAAQLLAACLAEQSDAPDSDHPLVAYLRSRKRALAAYRENGIFRSSLDAYDRHEIVLLSSAFGLPVRGKREINGQLIPTRTSSQVEPPNLLRPIDLEAGSALYRPRPLQLRELRLTALGGTLRHDSDFVPPTAARHISHGPLYDSFSIERWQHWVVLGRDVFAEVVYKGFLFPIGHRASLVKQTERVFLRATDAGGREYGSVRAYLRQRMFIRIGQPDKPFPAIGQPNMGRQFPATLIRFLTTVTPDLVDPFTGHERSAERGWQGRAGTGRTPLRVQAGSGVLAAHCAHFRHRSAFRGTRGQCVRSVAANLRG
jgi:hypothetical protein